MTCCSITSCAQLSRLHNACASPTHWRTPSLAIHLLSPNTLDKEAQLWRYKHRPARKNTVVDAARERVSECGRIDGPLSKVYSFLIGQIPLPAVFHHISLSGRKSRRRRPRLTQHPKHRRHKLTQNPLRNKAWNPSRATSCHRCQHSTVEVLSCPIRTPYSPGGE